MLAWFVGYLESSVNEVLGFIIRSHMSPCVHIDVNKGDRFRVYGDTIKVFFTMGTERRHGVYHCG